MAESELTLDERLQSAEVVPEDVYELLWEQVAELERDEVPAPDIHLFFDADDLATYKQAQAWWPLDAPGDYEFPTLRALCHQYHDARWGITFRDRLVARGHRVTAWLQAQGRDVANPNEGANPKRARKAREAKVKQPRPPKDTSKTEAYKAYLELCAQRKAADAVWAARCQEAYDAWAAMPAQI